MDEINKSAIGLVVISNIVICILIAVSLSLGHDAPWGAYYCLLESIAMVVAVGLYTRRVVVPVIHFEAVSIAVLESLVMFALGLTVGELSSRGDATAGVYILIFAVKIVVCAMVSCHLEVKNKP